MAITPADPTVIEAVAALLSDASNSRLRFTVADVSITPAILARVGRAIRSRTIRLLIDDSLGDFALYGHQTNTMGLPDTNLAALGRRALIVHEAVHAANDVRRLRVFPVNDEAAAHVAEMIWLRTHGMTATIRGNGTPQGDAWATFVAKADQVLAGRPLRPADTQALQRAIRALPHYADLGQERRQYTGI